MRTHGLVLIISVVLLLSACGGTALASADLTSNANAADVDFSTINFVRSLYQQNNAQVIMGFLYGGASELAGNLTNIE